MMNMITETIKIDGMSCAGACVRNVKRALATVEGLQVEEVGLGFARITYDASTDMGEESRCAIRDAGFKPQ